MASGKFNRRSWLYPLQLREKVGGPGVDQFRLVRRGHEQAEGRGHAQERGQGGRLRS